MTIIKHLSGRSLLALAISYTIGITLASLISLNEIPKIEVPGKDKSVHFLFYFFLTLFWNFALQKKYKNWALKYIVVSATIIYGIVIEVLQEVITQNRQADKYDVLANSAGALLALLVLFLLKKQNFKKKF